MANSYTNKNIKTELKWINQQHWQYDPRDMEARSVADNTEDLKNT